MHRDRESQPISQPVDVQRPRGITIRIDGLDEPADFVVVVAGKYPPVSYGDEDGYYEDDDESGEER